MWTHAGTCPRCGGQMAYPAVWHGVTPPPLVCMNGCGGRAQSWTSPNTTPPPVVGEAPGWMPRVYTPCGPPPAEPPRVGEQHFVIGTRGPWLGRVWDALTDPTDVEAAGAIPCDGRPLRRSDHGLQALRGFLFDAGCPYGIADADDHPRIPDLPHREVAG